MQQAQVSPVSLLDAVASHVSAAVTELGRIVFLQRATKAKQEQFAPSSAGTATNGLIHGLCMAEGLQPSVGHQCGLSDGSGWQGKQEREPACDERKSVAHWECRKSCTFLETVIANWAND